MIGKSVGLKLDDYENVVVDYELVLAEAPSSERPPNEPAYPSPVHSATGVSTTTTLYWEGGDQDGGTVTYDVYFEEGDSSPDVLVSQLQSETFYSPGVLNANTTYYWQINAKDDQGFATAGEVWQFTTGSGQSTPGEMVNIPAGSFQMGCDPVNNGGYECFGDALPLHMVYLNSFRIDKYEVTNGQYALCVSAGGCQPPYMTNSESRGDYYMNPVYSNYPVIGVNWQDSVNYCTWAGKRLPTEAEWKKAARGPGNTRAYPWGNQDPTCSLANSRNETTGLPCAPDTQPVGSYPAGASPYGVLDMAGNVWEWVSDWYAADYYSVSPSSNPQGPVTGEMKLFLGGAFRKHWYELLVARRFGGQPGAVYFEVGIRCAASGE